MYKSKHVKNDRSKGRNFKAGTLLISVLLLVAVAAGGTIAWLSTKTASIENKFIPSHVKCSVTEDFDGKRKSNVNVTNTGDIEAYIRVKLVTYRVNENGQHIGGTATIPPFDPGENWVLYNGFYYYTLPVNKNESPAEPLIGENGIDLISYTDTDGGKQVIEVMAEAIQSVPDKAVGQSWGVSISQGSVTAYSAGN